MNIEHVVAVIVTTLALAMALVETFNLSRWRGVSVGVAALGATWALCYLCGALIPS